MLPSCSGILAESICTTIRPEFKVPTYLFYMHTTIREKYMVLFHLIFLFCTTIRPKTRVYTDFFFFCTRPFDKCIWSSFIYSFFCVRPFDQKLSPHWFISLCTRPLYQKLVSSLIYLFSLYATIRPKICVLINLFFLFVHEHSTKVRRHSYFWIYYFLNWTNI